MTSGPRAPGQEQLPSLVVAAQAVARQLGFLAGDPRVEVVQGDALGFRPGQGPFDLLFADSGVRGPAYFAALVGALRLGGRIVMDNVTPEQALPAGSPLRAHDVKRQLFGQDARLIATEVVLPDLHNSLLVGTRIS